MAPKFSPDSMQSQMLDAIGEAVIATDLNGIIQYWNLAAEDLYQWRAEEVIGKNIVDVTPSNATRGQSVEIKNELIMGKSRKGDFEVQRKDGTTFLAYVTNTPIHDEEGELVGVIGVSRSITKQKQIENELWEIQSFMHSILENSQMGIFVLDVFDEEDFIYSYINPTQEIITGVDADQIVGESPEALKDVLGNEAVEAIYDLYRQCIRERQSIELEHSVNINGEQTWWFSRITPLADQNGVIFRLVGNALHITDRIVAEVELRENEKRLEAIFNNSPFAIALVNLDGTPIICNPAFGSMMGYEVEKIQKMNFTEFTHPEDLEMETPFFQEILDGKRDTYQIQKRNIHKEGHEIWLNVHIVGIRNDLGELEHLVALGEDISARIHSEKEVAFQAEVLGQVSDAIVVTNNDDEFTVAYWNKWAEKTYGWRADEVVGKSSLFLNTQFQDQDRDLSIAAITMGGSFEGEVIQTRKDGSQFPVETRLVSLRNDQREITGWIAVNRDISKRKQIEEALAKSEEKYRNFFDNNEVGVVVSNMEGQIFASNEALSRLIGYSKDEMLDLPATAFYANPEVRNDFVSKMLRDGRVNNFESQMNTKSGELIWISFTSTAFEYEGKNTFITSIIDISERKKAEELLMQQASLLEQVHNGIITFDFDNTILSWNKYAEVLYQWTAEEAVGKNMINLLSLEELQGVVVENLEDHYEDGHWEGDFEVKRKDGTTIPAHIINTFLKDGNGNNIGFIGISEDITDRKRAQQEMQRRIQEVERMNEMYVGREERMIGLKKEINELLQELGRPPKYSAPNQIDQLRSN